MTEAFAVCWVYAHGAPALLKYDPEFNSNSLATFCGAHGIQMAPLPARRHNKAGIVERKHREIRKFYNRLMASAPSDDMWAMVVAEATFLSNAAYGTKLASSFELAKGFT